MRTILTLFAAIVIVAACKKDKAVPPNPVDNTDSTDSTNVPKPQLKDSTIKIVGIDSVVEIECYDSIEIPITITRDTGTLRNIHLSISGLSYRVKAKFSNYSGNMPFTTTLKLSTYLVGGGKFSDSMITITATTDDGQQVKHSFRLKVNYNQDILKILYECYLKSPIWATFTFDPARLVANPPYFHYDSIKNNLYLTSIYVGEVNGKKYYTIDRIYAKGGFASYGDIYFEEKSVRCSSTSDTISVFVTPHFLNFYDNYGDDNTIPTIYMSYWASPPTLSNQHFTVKGNLKIDGFW